MNKQRENIYALRREILEGKIGAATTSVDARVPVAGRRSLDALVEHALPRGQAISSEWDLDALRRDVQRVLRHRRRGRSTSASKDARRDPRRALGGADRQAYEEKEQLVGREMLQRVERDIMLQIVDAQWKDHLYSLDHLKEGIGLRGYGQRDPLVEYKKESFELFQA